MVAKLTRQRKGTTWHLQPERILTRHFEQRGTFIKKLVLERLGLMPAMGLTQQLMSWHLTVQAWDLIAWP